MMKWKRWCSTQIDTLCIDGDNREATSLARAIREKMAGEKVEVSRLIR